VGGKVFLRFKHIEPGLKIWVMTGDGDPEFMISNLDLQTEEDKINPNSTRKIYEI
jgi:hypothetical protein